MARWSRTLSTLIASGVDILRALEITAQTTGNWVVEEETAKIRARVQEGATIAQPLIDSTVFPPMVAQMVKIGEETGELEKMLGEGRRLLRGRGRRVDRSPHLDHRAAHDGRRRHHGRHHHHQHVPADVQAADARQVAQRAASRRSTNVLDFSTSRCAGRRELRPAQGAELDPDMRLPGLVRARPAVRRLVHPRRHPGRRAVARDGCSRVFALVRLRFHGGTVVHRQGSR